MIDEQHPKYVGAQKMWKPKYNCCVSYVELNEYIEMVRLWCCQQEVLMLLMFVVYEWKMARNLLVMTWRSNMGLPTVGALCNERKVGLLSACMVAFCPSLWLHERTALGHGAADICYLPYQKHSKGPSLLDQGSIQEKTERKLTFQVIAQVEKCSDFGSLMIQIENADFRGFALDESQQLLAYNCR